MGGSSERLPPTGRCGPGASTVPRCHKAEYGGDAGEERHPPTASSGLPDSSAPLLSRELRNNGTDCLAQLKLRPALPELFGAAPKGRLTSGNQARPLDQTGAGNIAPHSPGVLGEGQHSEYSEINTKLLLGQRQTERVQRSVSLHQSPSITGLASASPHCWGSQWAAVDGTKG